MNAIAADKIETLNACIGNYPHTKALKSGDIKSDRVALNFTEVSPVNRAFMMMVRELKFDVCEMAIVTYLQAKAFGKPLMLSAGDDAGAISAKRAALQRGAWNAEGGGSPRPPGRGARVLADDGGVDSRHSLEGLWARPRQGELGDVRGRACC